MEPTDSSSTPSDNMNDKKGCPRCGKGQFGSGEVCESCGYDWNSNKKEESLAKSGCMGMLGVGLLVFALIFYIFSSLSVIGDGARDVGCLVRLFNLIILFSAIYCFILHLGARLE